MLSNSFKRGFVRGFSAPFLFFAPPTIRRPAQYNASVAKAWADVGRALDEATEKQGRIVEQKTGIAVSRPKKRNQAA